MKTKIDATDVRIVEELRKNARITMKELGARTEDIPELTRRVRRSPDGTVGQFQKLDDAAIERIFRIADR